VSVVLLLLIVILLATAGAAVVIFNRLIRLRNQVRAAWADIDVQLARRHDLVPALVSAVRAYAHHERATLAAVTELRAQALTLNSPARLGEVETALEQGLGRLIALQEAHPDLKANEPFAQLQRDLVAVEDHLQFARRFYNGAVRDYNTALERFPDLLMARAGAFVPAEFFQAGPGERAAVPVQLTTGGAT
jgi:LemA protein